MPAAKDQFNLPARILHWVMAVCIVSMLAIGMAMVVSLAYYHRLVAIHRPLGIVILGLAVLRLLNRLVSRSPEFPPTMSRQERFVATASEVLMYGLMFALPLVGWGMLSAARYPVVMFGSLHLPPILPHDIALYAVLRKAHTVLAYLFLATVIAHFSAILYHTLILRDGMLFRMLGGAKRLDSTTNQQR